MLGRDRLLGQYEKRPLSDLIVDVCLWILIIALAFLTFTKTYWLQPVTVSGSSMERTLQDNDVLLMDRLKKPTYGDVVIIYIGKDYLGNDINYIKRVIGLPGDTIYSSGGTVHRITGGVDLALDESKYVYYDPLYPKGTYFDTKLKDFYYNVGEGEFFYLGDNRWHSQDGRVKGTEKLENVLGVVPQWVIDNRNGFLGKFYQYI
ncbi:MAG: signal peptidase I [Clostridia bacterium]|nr:signal peptidase I [Clostridia bacterium]